MLLRSRLKSKTTLRSCKLLVLLLFVVLAMNVASNYLQHLYWLQRDNSRPTGTGIISAGCPDYLAHQIDKLKPTRRRPQLNHHNPNSDDGGQHTDAHRYGSDFVARLWQAALRPPIIVAQAIRLIRVEAPSSVEVGRPIKLRCLYELRGEKLLSLAWYKNGREFYRYQPSERRQPVLTFDLSGVAVDMSHSRNSTVYLVNTTMETTGRYKCEATSTTFREAKQEVFIRVMEPDASGVPRTTHSIVLILPYLIGVILSVRASHPSYDHTR